MHDEDSDPRMKSLGERIQEALAGGIDQQFLDEWKDREQAMREMAERLRVPPIEIDVPKPDPDLVQQPANIRRLVEINEATGEQIVGLAQITAASLEESRELRRTISDAESTQTKLTGAIIVLTAALVVLTYVLMAEAVHWWPFG